MALAPLDYQPGIKGPPLVVLKTGLDRGERCAETDNFAFAALTKTLQVAQVVDGLQQVAFAGTILAAEHNDPGREAYVEACIVAKVAQPEALDQHRQIIGSVVPGLKISPQNPSFAPSAAAGHGPPRCAADCPPRCQSSAQALRHAVRHPGQCRGAED